MKDDAEMRLAIAEIIFRRMTSQLPATVTTKQMWSESLKEFRNNPKLFPMIGACVEAAAEIVDHLEDMKKPE